MPRGRGRRPAIRRPYNPPRWNLRQRGGNPQQQQEIPAHQEPAAHQEPVLQQEPVMQPGPGPIQQEPVRQQNDPVPQQNPVQYQQNAPQMNNQVHVAAQEQPVAQPVPVQALGEISNTLYHTQPQMDEPLFVPGLLNEYDIFIPQTLKDKIWNFEYIDLSLLLKQNVVSNLNDNHNTLQIIDGKIIVQPKSKKIKSIDNIKTWTDAFIVYLQVILDNHPTKANELLKYMSVIRSLAEETITERWVQYDQQFRLRISRNPSKSWANIDAELWLRFVAKGPVAQNASSKSSRYPCYEFNFKGNCAKAQCIYRHTCMKCNMPHAAISCGQFEGFGSTNHAFQAPRQIRPTIRNQRPNYNIHTPVPPLLQNNYRPRNFVPRR